MDIDDFRDGLIIEATTGAKEFLESGKYGGEFSEAVDRVVENEGALRVFAMILRGDDAKAITKALEEEMFSERHCEREIERAESIEEENRADAKRYDESMEK